MQKGSVKRFFAWLLVLAILLSTSVYPLPSFAEGASISTPLDYYEVGESLAVTVTDPSLSGNGEVDTVDVKVTSSTANPEGFVTQFYEDQSDSGIFTRTIGLSQVTDANAQNPTISAYTLDTVSFAYGILKKEIKMVDILTQTSFDTCNIGDVFLVQLFYPGINNDNSTRQEVPVTVTSNINPEASIQLILEEDGMDSDEFRGQIIVSGTETSQENAIIQSAPGKTLKFKYDRFETMVIVNNPVPPATTNATLNVLSSTGVPVHNARVELKRVTGEGFRMYTSNANGQVMITMDFHPADYLIYVYPPDGSSDAMVKLAFPQLQGENASFDVSLNESIKTVYVKNPDNTPAQGGCIEVVSVVDGRKQWIINGPLMSGGVFNIPKLTDGDYQVRAIPAGNTNYSATSWVDLSLSGNVATMATDILLLNESQIIGSVNLPNNLGIAATNDYYIRYQPVNPTPGLYYDSFFSRDEDSFKIGGLQAGTYIISAVSKNTNYTDSFSQTVTVNEGQFNQVVSLQLTMPQVTGTVLLPDNTVFQNGGWINLYDSNQKLMNDPLSFSPADGSFKIGGLAEGTYYLKARPQDGPTYMSSGYARITIDSEGNCTSTDPNPLVLNLMNKAPVLSYTQDSWRYFSNQVRAQIENYSKIEDMSLLEATITGNGVNLAVEDLRLENQRPDQDRCDLIVDFHDPLELPYGQYTLSLVYNGIPLQQSYEDSNKFMIMAYLAINPRVVTSGDYELGTTFTVDVEKHGDYEKTYPWDSDSGSIITTTIFNDSTRHSESVTANHVADSDLVTFTNANNWTGEYGDGHRSVSLYVDDKKIAGGYFDVGNTIIKEIVYFEGQDHISVLGSYLDKYLYDDMKAELWKDGVKIAESNNRGTGNDRYNFYFDRSLLGCEDATFKLIINGTATDYPIRKVPMLSSADPIISGDHAGEQIIINETGELWEADEDITARVRHQWGQPDFISSAAKGLSVESNQIKLNTTENNNYGFQMPRGQYNVELYKGDTLIGSTYMYVGDEPYNIVKAQVQDTQGNASAFGYMEIQKDNQGRRINVGSDGMVYLNANDLFGGGDYSGIVYPAPGSGLCPSERFTFHWDGSSIDGFLDTVNLPDPVATAWLKNPDGVPTNNGYINISRKKDDRNYEFYVGMRVDDSGAMLIPPLPAGSYQIAGDPNYDADYVRSETLDITSDGTHIYLDGVQKDNLALKLRDVQIRVAIKDPSGNDTIKGYEYYINLMSTGSGGLSQYATHFKDGVCLIGGLEPGSYILRTMYTGNREYSASYPQTIQFDGSYTEASFDLTNPQITGIVSDGSNFIQDGYIDVLDENYNYLGYNVQIRNGGQFKIGGLEDGKYYLQVTAFNSSFDRYFYYPMVIENGLCTTPNPTLILQTAMPRLARTNAIFKGSEESDVEIANISKLGDLSDVKVKITDLDNHVLKTMNARYIDVFDPHGDRGRLVFESQETNQLPYGQYKLQVYKGEALIDKMGSNTFDLVSGTDIRPKVVAPDKFGSGSPGQVFTLKQPDGDPWASEGDNIVAKIYRNEKLMEDITVPVTVTGNISSFEIPQDTVMPEKWYGVDFFKVEGGQEKLLAMGGFDVGVVKVNTIEALQGGDWLTIKGELLYDFASEGCYIELIADGAKILASRDYHEFNGGHDMTWFLEYQMEYGKSYKLNLYVPGRGYVIQNRDVSVIPLLDSEDIIIDEQDEVTTLQANTALGLGWASSDVLAVTVREIWSGEKVPLEGVTVSDNAISFSYDNTPGAYTIEIKKNDAYLGYSTIYTVDDADDVLVATISDSKGDPTHGIVYYHNDEAKVYEKSIIGLDSKAYFHKRYLERAYGKTINLYARAPISISDSDGSAQVGVNSNGFSSTNISISYDATQLSGTVLQPDHETALNGDVEIFDKRDGHSVQRARIQAGGIFKFSGINPGTYVLRAYPYDGNAFVASKDYEVVLGSNPIKNIVLRFEEPQLSVTVTNPDGEPAYFEKHSLFIRSVQKTYFRCETNKAGETGYIGSLPQGEYDVLVVPNQRDAYSQSLPTRIIIAEDGTCSPAAIELQYTNPVRTGVVHTTAHQPTQESNVEVFKKNGKNLDFVSWLPLDPQGRFYLGGLPAGEYLLRAYPFNSDNYGATELIPVELPGTGLITLTLRDKTIHSKDAQTVTIGSDRMRVRIVNAKSIDDSNKLSAEILDADGQALNPAVTIPNGRIWLDYGTHDGQLDEVDAELNIDGRLKLPYGIYKLRLSYNGNPITPDDDGLFLVCYGMDIQPRVASPAKFEAGGQGQVFTFEQWDGELWASQLDTLYAVIHSNRGSIADFTVPVQVDGKVVSFTIPEGSKLPESGYDVDFFKEDNSDDILMAKGFFDVGNVRVDAITAYEGADWLTIRGDYLQAYTSGGSYLEIKENGTKIRQTYRVDQWSNNELAWRPDYQFQANKTYTVSLYVPGRGFMLEDEPLTVISLLDSDDLIVDTANEITTLRVNPAGGPGWISGDNLTVTVKEFWNSVNEVIQNVTVLDNAISFSFDNESGGYTVEVMKDGTYLGYISIYTVDDANDVLVGTIKDANGDPARGVVYLHLRDRIYEPAIVGLDSKFYFHKRYFNQAYGNALEVLAYAPENITDIDTSGQVNVNEDGFDPAALTLQYKPAKLSGTVMMPNGKPAFSGSVQLFDKNDGHHITDTKILANGKFKIGDILPGSYWIRAYPDQNVPYVTSPNMEVTLSAEPIDDLALEFSDPQLTVTIKDPDGNPASFEPHHIMIRKVNPKQSDHRETNKMGDIGYVGDLEPGSYDVLVVNNQVDPYSQSTPTRITINQDGTCTPASVALQLTEPDLTGIVHDLNGNPTENGYVEVFKQFGNTMQFISWLPLDRKGQFYLGGLPTGEYLLRAVPDDIGQMGASKFMSVTLGEDTGITIKLRTKALLSKDAQDIAMGDDRMRVRLVNKSGIEDVSLLSAEVLDSAGNQLPERIIVPSDKIWIDEGTYAHHVDEVDAELRFDGGLNLPFGTYQIQFTYGDNPVAFDDDGFFHVYYGTYVSPFVVTPDKVLGKVIKMEPNKPDITPWTINDTMNAEFYDSLGNKINLPCAHDTDGSLLIELPLLSEDDYQIRILKNGQTVALGGLTVGDVYIKGIVPVTQGDDGINVYGRNLGVYRDGNFAAQVYKDDHKIYETQGILNSTDFNDAIMLDFNDNTLQPGEYTLRMQFNGVEQVLPNGGSFKVVPRLDPSPVYHNAANVTGQTITLKTRTGITPTWALGDNLKVEFFSEGRYYNLIQTVNFTVNADTIVLTLPENIVKGRYWVNISKTDEVEDVDCIACAEFFVIDDLQLTGKVKIAGSDTVIPYAEVEIFNETDGRHLDASADGSFYVYGLGEGEYRINAIAPDGTKYISFGAPLVTLDNNSATPAVIQDLYLHPANTVSGTISLPNGEVAPKKGLEVGVLAVSKGDEADENDDVNSWKVIVIPEGSNSIGYNTLVPTDRSDIILYFWPINQSDYCGQRYAAAGTAYSDAEATLLNGSLPEQTGMNVTLSKGHTISGTVTLPEPATQNVKIVVHGIMYNDKMSKTDDYDYGTELVIEQGKQSIPYSFTVPIVTSDEGFQVFYEIREGSGYEKLGYFGSNGTVYQPDLSQPIDARTGDKTGIDLLVSVPLSPKFVKSAVSEDGTKVYIKMSKPIKAETIAANSANGFIFTVDGVPYELSNVGALDNSLVLTLKDYIVLKGKVLSLSYDKTVGDIASYDDMELESFTKPVENQSNKEIIVSGIANNGLTKDNVNLTVTAAGLNITLKQGENTLETGTGIVTHLFEEGTYTVTIIVAEVKDPLTWSFTVDKTAPTITFISGCVNVDNPSEGVKPVINWGDSVANTRTLTINNQSVNVEAIPTLRDGGTYELVATAQDAAGNVRTATVTFTITWDTAQPTIQSNVTDGFIYDISVTPTITLTGGTNAANYTYTAELTRPGGNKETYTKGGDPIPQLDAEGYYNLKVTATNPSDQNYLRTVTFNFAIDKTAPTATITGVINDKSYNTQQVVPVISYSDAVASEATLLTNATVTLTKNGESVTCTAGNPITEEGAYVLTAKTRDGKNHESNVATVSFVIDRTAPTITIAGCSNIENNHAGITPVITFSGDCVPETKTATLNGQAYDFVGTPAIKGIGELTTYTLLVTARDKAGNLASEQVVFTVKWDVNVPMVQTGIINNAILESVTPVITLTGGTNQPNYTFTATLTKPDLATVNYTNGQVIPTLSAEGAYTLAVHAVNPSYVNIVSDYTVSFTVDNQAPTASITNVDNGSIYKTDVTPGFTYNDSVAANTTLLANATVVLKKNGSVIPYVSGTVIEAEGAYELTAKTKDAFGHDSNVASVTFTIDKTAPLIGVAGVANGGLYRTNITPVITFSDAVTSSADLLANATITLNGSPYTPGTTISTEITHTLVINTADAAGNAAATKTIVFTIDKTAPTITITGCNDITNEPAGVTPAIAFAGDIETTRSATLNGLSYDIKNPTAIKAPGSYVLLVSSRDAAGNVGTAKAEFTITWDQTAPVITVNGVTNGSWYTTATPSVSLSGGSNSGNYTYSVKLFRNGSLNEAWTSGTAVNEQGLYRLEVTAVNPSYTNITSTKTVEFSIDSIAPTAAITGVTNSSLYNTPVNPVITFIDTMASQQLLWKNATISLTRGGQPVTTYKAGDTISLDGSYILTASTKDAVDNQSNAASVAFTIDRTKPVISLSGVLNGYTYKDQNVTLIATANEDADLNVTANGSAIALVNGSYTFEGTAGQVVSYRVILTATDAAGNVATQELQFTIDKLPVNILITGISEGQIINYNPMIAYVTYVGVDEREGTTAKMDGQAYNPATVLAEGLHTFTATYVAGPNTYTKEVRFTIDKTAPAISNVNVFKNNNNSASSGSVYVKSGDTLTIKARIAEPNGIKAVTFNVGALVTKVPMIFNQASGYYEGTYSVPGGDSADLSVTIEAMDKTGNSGNLKSQACVIFIDNTKPVVTRATTPSSPDGQNGYFKTANMSVTLTAGPNEKITYSQNGIHYDPNTNSVTLTPDQGDNLLVYRATDLAGNVSDDKIYVFKLDSTNPPQVTLSSPTTGIVNTELIRITGSVAGEGGKGTKVVLKRSGAVIGTTSVKTDNTFEFDGVRLLEGVNSLDLRAVDMAGNESSQARGLTRTLDSTSPLLIIEKTGDHLYILTANENINGVTAKFNGVDVADGSISSVIPNRSFNIQTPDEIEGLNTLTVMAKDAAENIGTGSYSSTFIPTSAQNGLQIGDNTTMDIPAGAFNNSIQMVVRTVSIDQEISYKPISSPVEFDFGNAELKKAIVIRLQIGLGLKGVMLMHINDNGEPDAPVAAISVEDSTGFAAESIELDTPYYLEDTGELVFRTMTFSSYGAVQDQTGPTVSITTGDYYINKLDYEAGTPDGIYLSGSLNEPGRITSVKIKGIEMNLGGIAAADLDESFNIPLNITDDGTYEVAIIAKDNADNASDTVIRTFYVDIHNPVITIADPVAITNRNSVDLNVTTNEMTTIKRDTTWLTDDVGSFIATCSLVEGNNSIVLTAKDAFGNTSTSNTVTIHSDTTAPVITIDGVSDGDVRGSAANITINVTDANAFTRITTLDGGNVAGNTVNVAGEGLHTLTVTATDAAGNVSSEEISFTIDTSVPTITVSGAVNNGKSGVGKTLTVTAANADTMTIIRAVNGGAATAVADAGNDLTENVILEAVNGQETVYSVRVTATKTVGTEVRSASSTFIYTVDKKAPSLTVSAPAQTSESTVTITGTLDETSDVYLNGSKVIDDQPAGNFTLSNIALGNALQDYTFTIVAKDAYNNETTRTVTVKKIAPQVVDPGNGGGGGGAFGGGPAIGPVQPGATVTGSTIAYNPVIEGGIATSSLSVEDINTAFIGATADASGKKTIVLNVAKADGVLAYVQEIPSSVLTTGTAKQQYEINTAVATLTVPGNMFSAKDLAKTQEMGISIGLADTSKLKKELKDQIGNKPVLELKAMADGKQFTWNNPSAPVTIEIPYTPTAEELKDIDHITVWYIDGNGKVIEVPNAKYDPATKTVIFTTTHFSKYAVAYVNKTYEDLGGTYGKAIIEALASKGFYASMVTGTKFNPNRSITRAEFIYLVVTALDLHASFDSNFSDVNATDYYYEAAGIAKKLGITSGVGNNKLGVNMSITRQDMATILVKALNIANKNYPVGSINDLKAFKDFNKITGYAQDSLAILVKAGILNGYNKILDPNGTFTMQHAAVVIYKIYKK